MLGVVLVLAKLLLLFVPTFVGSLGKKIRKRERGITPKSVRTVSGFGSEMLIFSHDVPGSSNPSAGRNLPERNYKSKRWSCSPLSE